MGAYGMYVLGMDTSNYRTSICMMDEKGRVYLDQRKLLEVKAGERGLQQSAAVFQHIKHLPELIDGPSTLSGSLRAIAVSAAPRPAQNSYMPVFQVGVSYARWLARFLSVPCFQTTHQEGHLAAGVWSLGDTGKQLDQAAAFTAVHLSGGTSEILVVEPTPTGYKTETIGGSTDLYAGQLIDRVGVALGLPFPAGPSLEQLALQGGGESKLRISSSVKGTWFSFSGPETQALRYLSAGMSPAAIARAIEICVANTLEKALRNAFVAGYPKNVLWVGGVMANRWIKNRLQQRLEHPAVGAKCYFSAPEYSGDNACGVALLGWKQLLAGGSKFRKGEYDVCTSD